MFTVQVTKRLALYSFYADVCTGITILVRKFFLLEVFKGEIRNAGKKKCNKLNKPRAAIWTAMQLSTNFRWQHHCIFYMTSVSKQVMNTHTTYMWQFTCEESNYGDGDASVIDYVNESVIAMTDL